MVAATLEPGVELERGFTNDFGEALFRLPGANYTLTATAAGFEGQSRSFNVSNNSIRTAEFRLTHSGCDFDAEAVQEFCDGNQAWLAIRVQNNLFINNSIQTSYSSPLAIGGDFNASFGGKENRTLNFTAQLSRGFGGFQAAQLFVRGINSPQLCQREFTLGLCSDTGISLSVREPSKDAFPDSKACTAVTLRNNADKSANIELVSFGSFEAHFSEDRFFLGARETKAVEYCVDVPAGADGSRAFVVRVNSEFAPAEALFSLTVRGQSFFTANYSGCSSDGSCPCVEVPSQGRELLAIDLFNNGGKAGSYSLQGTLSRPGITADYSQNSLHGFNSGSKRQVLADVVSNSPQAGDYSLPLRLYSDKANLVFEKQICLSVPLLLKASAEILEKELVVPRPGGGTATMLVTNEGNSAAQFTITQTSPFITASETSFSLDAGEQKKVELAIDTENLNDGKQEGHVQMLVEKDGDQLSLTLDLEFTVAPASSIPRRTALSGLALKQAGDFTVPEKGEARLPVVVQNNNPFTANDVALYAVGLPPGVVGQLAEAFSLKPFEEELVFVKITALNAQEGVYPFVLKAEYSKETVEKDFLLRVGKRGVELQVAISQSPVAYSFDNGFSQAFVNFTGRSNEPLPTQVSSRLDGMGSEWAIEISPQSAGLLPGQDQLFQVKLSAPGRPASDYNTTFVLAAADGRSSAALARIAPKEASSGLTGFLLFGDAGIALAAVVLMLLMAAVLLLSSRRNLEDQRETLLKSR